jgi:putative DNA primase/helicase
LLKQLTGGDKIRARRMREDYWEFKPTHKIVLATNHRPSIRGTDNGIWRRVKLVPFAESFTGAKKDKLMKDKLEAEYPGILAWAVRGCLEWQQNGLQHPPEVEVATQDYRQEMDTISEFLDQCCVRATNARERHASLYDAYQHWTRQSGTRPLPRNDFGDELKSRGFEARRSASNGGSQWHGLRLLGEGELEQVEEHVQETTAPPAGDPDPLAGLDLS